MSLLINGMNMPKNCAECLILEIGSLEHYCPLAKESMESIDTESGKHKNCPLSEVPTPHGDLIDRNLLLKEYESDPEDDQMMKEESLKSYVLMTKIVDLVTESINKMPIIIKAEG